jgi:putative DNA primase/helicase
MMKFRFECAPMTITLQTIARALGGEVTGRQVLAPGPGHSAKDRSLAVSLSNDAPDGFVLYSHAGDDWRACRDYVRGKLGLPAWQPGDGREQQRTVQPSHVDKWDFGTVDAQAEAKQRTEDDLIRIGWAQAIFKEAMDPKQPEVTGYMQSRALVLPDELASSALRFHPLCPWRNESTGQIDRISCLIAAFKSIDDDIITGIHRIRLDRPERWPKTERRMLGVVHRAAVKLGAPAGKLTIGEGLETCMAACQLGLGPAWALGSAGAISFFPVIDGVSELKILAEAGDASARAIQICGRRWRRAGRRVLISRPNVGSDHNDVLMKRRVS